MEAVFPEPELDNATSSEDSGAKVPDESQGNIQGQLRSLELDVEQIRARLTATELLLKKYLSNLT